MDINRKMKNGYRRLLSFLVALYLTVGFVLFMSVPVTASTHERTTALNFSSNPATQSCNVCDTCWHWDNAIRTLTLTDFTLNLSTSNTMPNGITLPADSTIILVGTNDIRGNPNAGSYNSSSFGIQANGNLVIEGTGVLDVASSATRGDSSHSYAIRVLNSGNLTINSGTITARAGAAHSTGTNSCSWGISATGGIIINGGTVFARGSNFTAPQRSLGIFSSTDLIINGGTVTAQGFSNSLNRAPVLPAAFNAWVSTAAADPGGDPSTSYTFNDNHRFVRIESIVPAVEVTVNGNATPAVGAARTDGIDIDTGSPHFTVSVAWSPDHTTFAANTAYTATATLTAINGFSFRNFSGTSSINGTNVTLTPDTDGETATMSMTFPATAPERKAIVNDQTSANFSVDSDNLQYILDNHIVTEDDIANNNSVTLTLTVKETDDTAEGAESIIELSQGQLLQFFDITIEKQINSNTPVRLTELPAPVEITIDLSEELSGRTGYTVYRYHNGVQRIGTDTDTGEYFTVSRGTGVSNVDQIIINTRRFSTFAVVENIVTLDDLDNSEDVDVQARIVDLTVPIYRIDIAWGDMKFIYNINGSAGTWNPETASYDNPIAVGWSGFEDGNNEIMVWNHSNAGVLVGFTMTEIGLVSPVTMELFIDNIENGTPATNLPLSKVPRNRADLNDVESISAYLRLKGTPNEDDIARLEGDVWHRIGIITVTITPDGDVLTPLR